MLFESAGRCHPWIQAGGDPLDELPDLERNVWGTGHSRPSADPQDRGHAGPLSIDGESVDGCAAHLARLTWRAPGREH